MIRGIALDMDGTVTKPVLDFAAIRRDVGAPPKGPPVLEFFETLPPREKTRAYEILLRHERHAAEIAEFNTGAREFFEYLEKEGMPRALITRNGEHTTARVLEKLGIEFSVVVTRDSGVGIKPSPEPLLYVINQWNLAPGEVLMVGDFLYDALMGRRAGCRTAFLTNGREPPEGLDADIVVDSLDQLIKHLKKDRAEK